MMVLKNDRGQSTIEFLSTFIFILGFMFLYLKVALNYTNGYLQHYVTYMASRAYLVHDGNDNTPGGSDQRAETIAQEVYRTFPLDTFISGFEGSLVINAPEAIFPRPYVGAFSTYEDKFSFTPVMGGGASLDFLSESFLGREPTRSTCVDRVCRAFSEVEGASCDKHVTVDDNGC